MVFKIVLCRRWLVEKGNQPAVNFVKALDGHWKAILSAEAGMQDLTSPSFPLHFVQVARVLWFVAMLAMPWDWAADLGLHKPVKKHECDKCCGGKGIAYCKATR